MSTDEHLVEYAVERTLLESEADPDPFRQFARWLQEVTEVGEPLAHAMSLATVNGHGLPSVRTVLMETVDDRGFIFQTNLESPKARDLTANPNAAATFFWRSFVRQVRLSGRIQQLPPQEALAFYEPMADPIKAMLQVCRQSEVIPDRQTLEQAFARGLASSERGQPQHWGAYRLVPEWIEFFQGRQHWLQDRLRYTRTSGNAWQMQRLVP